MGFRLLSGKSNEDPERRMARLRLLAERRARENEEFLQHVRGKLGVLPRVPELPKKPRLVWTNPHM
jgi:hypothetical protein